MQSHSLDAALPFCLLRLFYSYRPILLLVKISFKNLAGWQYKMQICREFLILYFAVYGINPNKNQRWMIKSERAKL